MRFRFNIRSSRTKEYSQGNPMTRIPGRFIPPSLFCACVAGVALMGAALSQPGPGPAPGPGGPGPSPGPGPGGGGPGPGPGGPSPTVTFRLCNQTKNTPLIFVSTVTIVGKQFRAQGWTQVTQGQCAILTGVERPKLWWYGRAPSGTYWGEPSAVDICVNFNAGFDYTWPGSGRSCLQGETLVGFKENELPANANENTQNLID